MWSKFTNVLKSNNTTKDESSASHGQVLGKVKEQHPNLSMFHANESGVMQQPLPEPSSPSIHGKRNMFKRLSRGALKDDFDGPRSASPMLQPPPLPSKVRDSSELSNANESQHFSEAAREVPRRSSFDMLRPSPPRDSQDTTRSVKDTRKRPSLDLLRQHTPQSSQDSMRGRGDLAEPDFLSTPGMDKLGGGSVRSILRDRNTPGTGQNVRFFSKDAYKVITPDQSLSTEFQEKPQPPVPQHENPFLDRLSQTPFGDHLAQPTHPASSTPPSLTRGGSVSKPRPKLAGLFSPLEEQENSQPANSDMSLSFSKPAPTTDYSNLFDVSQQLDIPVFPPPGLNFDVHAPIFEGTSFDTSANDISYVVRDADTGGGQTSTPYKGKERATEEDSVSVEVPAPDIIDDGIFHRKEKSQQLLGHLHERSQSFSFGQTVFYSMANSASVPAEIEPSYPSSDLKPSLDSVTSSSPAPTPPSIKSRSRAMSDTVFQSMLRSSPKPALPEADINDESSSGLVVYSGGASEPDPFSANANTYYTPQTMIPTTPPKGFPRHNRKTSKEENLIISLQTQLALRTELCAQYEADLKARDELVEILGKKLSDVEKDEGKRKNALRSWKKKVQEMERACRQLEEEVDNSRQESMERSVMDEASSEALRMLHRQIASLEREKSDWAKKEHALQDEVETLEALVRDRSEDIMNLKETLWNRDESERELKDGIQEAKEQIEMLGNISLVGVDEDELRRLMMEKDQKNSEETQRFRNVEFELRQELEELKTKYEGLEVQKRSWEEQLEGLQQQLGGRDEEYATLKAELEAQWQNTEKAGEKMELLEQEKTDIAAEKDALRADVQNLEMQISNMESDWTESENKKNELEAELQEVWNMKDALEKERDQLEDTLHHERGMVDQLERAIQERDTHISSLEQEKHFASDSVARLEENLRHRDEELAQYTERIVNGETAVEQLREEMSNLKREHSHVVNEQSRAIQDAALQQQEMQNRMDELVRAKAEADVELKTSKNRVAALKEEVDRLRQQVHALQQDSADKTLKVTQFEKQVSQDREDLKGLNVALEAKQQELELIKRKQGVRGTAGSTPAQPSKVAHRRDSSIFTAAPAPRPPSALSEAGSETGSGIMRRPERKNSSETPISAVKVGALGKSTRVNGGAMSASTSASASKPLRSEGSMGPPPVSMKPRPSINGTPTPAARGSSGSLARSSSARSAMTSPTASSTPMQHRRVSSVATAETPQARTKIARATVNASPAPSAVSELDEKENVDTSSSTARQRSMVPSLA